MKNIKKRINKNFIYTLPYTIWMIGFIIIPLFFIIYYSFTNKSGNFTLDNIFSFFLPVHLKSFLLSVKLAFISTFICIILSYPIALILKSFNIKNNSFMVYIFILPMWMNSLLRIFAWLTLKKKKGIINLFLSFLRLPNIYIINTEYAVILGLVYNFLPFMILPIYNSIIKIDDNTINAAYDLGADFLSTFKKVILPLSIPGMVSGIAMVFIPALTTIVISYFLGGGEMLLIGNVIEQEFIQTNNWNVGSGISFVLIIFIFITIFISSKYYDIEDGTVL